MNPGLWCVMLTGLCWLGSGLGCAESLEPAQVAPAGQTVGAAPELAEAAAWRASQPEPAPCESAAEELEAPLPADEEDLAPDADCQEEHPLEADLTEPVPPVAPAPPPPSEEAVPRDPGIEVVPAEEDGTPPGWGRFSFEVRDTDSGELIPCKISVVGRDGTPNPLLGRARGRRLPGSIAAHHRAMSVTGYGSLVLPAGVYDVHISRGPEWQTQVLGGLRAGPPIHVRAWLQRAFDTSGWISADLHVHARPSGDSHVSLTARVHQFASDGVELMVATDHWSLTDYRPVIEALGLGDQLASAVGQEVTSKSWGHFSAFPLPLRMERKDRGAVPANGKPPQLFARVRRVNAKAVIIANHPRMGRRGYFDAAGYDPIADDAETPEAWSWDFDAVEVLNGYMAPWWREILPRNLRDWFGLLAHGHRVVATGSSDTHRLDINLGGYPRNYLAVPDDAPAAMTPQRLLDALRGGRLFFTTGPFIRFTSGGAGIGDVVDASAGLARLEIGVWAADWIGVDEVTLYLDGLPHRRWTVPPSSEALRFHEEVEVRLERDAHAIVIASGQRPLWPVAGERHFPTTPVAVTNPIYLDVDSNGRYDAPRLFLQEHPGGADLVRREHLYRHARKRTGPRPGAKKRR